MAPTPLRTAPDKHCPLLSAPIRPTTPQQEPHPLANQGTSEAMFRSSSTETTTTQQVPRPPNNQGTSEAMFRYSPTQTQHPTIREVLSTKPLPTQRPLPKNRERGGGGAGGGAAREVRASFVVGLDAFSAGGLARRGGWVGGRVSPRAGRIQAHHGVQTRTDRDATAASPPGPAKPGAHVSAPALRRPWAKR